MFYRNANYLFYGLLERIDFICQHFLSVFIRLRGRATETQGALPDCVLCLAHALRE